MIKTVTHKFPMRIASGKTSILKLCKEVEFDVKIADNNLLILEDEIIDPRHDVVLVQSGEDYVEFDVISKGEYAANYEAM